MKNTDIEIIADIKKLLTGKHCKVSVIPHENPDGDAIGSAIGISEILKEFGHQVSIISPTEYPDFLKWFSSEIKIHIYSAEKQAAEDVIMQSDILICVDFNEAKRAGKLEKVITNFEKPSILIDHHPYPTNFCDYPISETGYSSTAELVFDVVNSIGLGNKVTTKSAEALYTGILTDTGSFSHNTSNPNTFKVVSELMKFGIAVEKIQSGVYHNFSADRMRLLGYCLNNKMVVFPELRTAMISISKKELKEFNFKTGDTEGFVNFPLSIANIVFSAIFIEKDGIIKASFRSKGNFHVNHFSRDHFNGGGHRNAAGGEAKLTLEAAVEKFRQVLPLYKNQLLETEI